jgi:hypothetical protein
VVGGEQWKCSLTTVQLRKRIEVRSISPLDSWDGGRVSVDEISHSDRLVIESARFNFVSV